MALVKRCAMKPFVIYFPQFYPTKTNDDAWGAGFTDWSLVANANLRNSWVRRAPRRGFYDGSSAPVHLEQIEEMKYFKLGGVAVYHYWFFTHQELGAFENTLLGRDSKFPWFLIWATESWSKRWLGDSSKIISLDDSPTDYDIEVHCDYIARCFSNGFYLNLFGKPFFVFYNLAHFSNPGEVVGSYRRALNDRGFDVCFGHFVKNPFDFQYSSYVDVSYLFEPRLFFGAQRIGRGRGAKKIYDVIKKLMGGDASRFLTFVDRFQQRGTSYRPEDFLLYIESCDRRGGVMDLNGQIQDVLSPGWNNTPRYSERFTALDNINPRDFSRLVCQSSNNNRSIPVLLNAWNEWSEGAAVEPCAYFGDRYLSAISSAF